MPLPAKHPPSLKFGLTIAILGLASTARPNDGAIGDDNGTIVFRQQADVSMDSEALFISEELVRVDYTFTNRSSKDLTVPIAFPMPPMYFGDADHGEIEDFKLRVDGRAVQTLRKLVVMLSSGKTGEAAVDVSEAFARSGWKTRELAEFLSDGAVPKGRKPLPATWFDANGEPRFTISEYFVWSQPFPPGKPVSISHDYKPSLTTGVPQSNALLTEWYGDAACVDKSMRASMRKRDQGQGLQWSLLSYILMTAKTWQGPIKDFKLTIRKKSPSDLVSLCLDGDLRKVDPGTFEFQQRDFTPKADLKVLFVRDFPQE